MFGPWLNNTDLLREKYVTAKPFEYVVIHNFFSKEYAEKVLSEFPDPDGSWWPYDNPFEQKFLFNNFSTPVMKELFEHLNSPSFTKIISDITSILDLESDPHLHSAGLHAYPRNGKLDIHLDYTIHPISGKERRTSLMIYMTKNWKKEWGGNLQLWDPDLSNSQELDIDLWNTAVLFKTSGDAYHGFPEPITCPHGTFRKVMGLYYLSEPREETLKNPRYRAELFPRPGHVIPDKLKKLYDIRRERRLEPSDFSDWPNWRSECGLDK